ncbi:DUF4194 domain-containing protein [Cryobacterium sp. 5B3]|uniref:DUF4194 domain-containing protein n=1 Tax=Cryobacterium sp. 5B3 TaxID=3048586 RepID=UPI002AB5AAE1|nr:DUF4194 domain-containing protein [Cryobacterium sp. 5B3]MDY7541794.1 DUF4194 domain-containing protein [Cryobacterium sp. 5B3]MEB0275226.1 DUF4194 domain-containing protein [Cryobacterium sp. 5B3]
MTDTLTNDEGVLAADSIDTDPIYDLDTFDAVDEHDVEAAPNYEDDEADQTSLAMFEGDTGTLFPEQRRCLHALLKHRYISAERHPEQWAVLLGNEGIIKSHLNNLFLELHVDRDFQVAFKRQASSETGDALPSLLRDISHTKEETIMMLFLRQRFFAQRQEGEDVAFVDRQTLLDDVADQRPEHATHRAMDQKRSAKAIDGLASAGVLLKTGDPDRFRISPIIEVLLPIERVHALTTWLMTRNGTDAPVADDSGDPDSDTDGTLDSLFDIEEEDA